MYEYTCQNTDCGHTSEKKLKVEDRDSPVECSKCGSISIRIISKTSPPIFSGDGWTPKFG